MRQFMTRKTSNKCMNHTIWILCMEEGRLQNSSKQCPLQPDNSTAVAFLPILRTVTPVKMVSELNVQFLR
jgi:hypothetical protein